ncbi:HoxN/HupN/NixA family nickel/cobalt transporter [Acetobacter sp. LMG 32666]|uniref:HoxN/HupN/NixA family nickel/cobalt transporter n=1 Tax=Acetobacter sp. LMG 32666 TaxID=2959295 RepID=UPI0030C86F09
MRQDPFTLAPDPAWLPNRAILAARSAQGYWLLAALLLFNALAWTAAWFCLGGNATLLASALLAWVFGLRHAMDADHIVAIDLVTRKLMVAGRSPLGVGLFFSLGHSSVVCLAVLFLAVLPTHDWLERWHLVGGSIGSAVSVTFLFLMAGYNVYAVARQWQMFRNKADMPDTVSGGLMARLFGPAFRLIGRSWQMYPLGFLFGLGFDTATEVGLLGLAAAQSAQGLGLVGILMFPLLFTAGMSAIDTLDAVLMMRAYGWSAQTRTRRQIYNLAITSVSALAALGVGATEYAAGLGEGGVAGSSLVSMASMLAEHFPLLGSAIMAVFLALWAGAFVWDKAAARRAEMVTPAPPTRT